MTFKTPQQGYIAKSKYARYLDAELRRESWPETVARYFAFAREHVAEKFPHALGAWQEVEARLETSVLRLETMPSMRLLMTAGEAIKRNHLAAYNCHASAINAVHKFSDMLLILMHGTGSGFSCERQEIAKLPSVPGQIRKTGDVLQVEDSKEGWADAYFHLLTFLYRGTEPSIDYSKIRPRGARLKTFGGRASGPEPLKRLFEFTVSVFRNAQGRKLTSIEVHDVCCMIADIVVVGGVRRSALISLSNLSDRRMRDAKIGAWWAEHPHRALANNSAVYTEKPDAETFMEEWLSLVKSKSGERGIFNREAATKQASRWGRRSENHDYLVNPCCVTGDTFVLTIDGHLPIKDLVGKPTLVWNGEQWSEVTPFSVGEHPVFRVSLSDGSYVDCTANHKFVLGEGFRGKTFRRMTSELSPGDRLAKFDMPIVLLGEEYPVDAYSQGFYSGDGNRDSSRSWVYLPKLMCAPRLIGEVQEANLTYGRCCWVHGPMLPKSFVPVNGSLSYRLNWLAGVLDSDGTVTRDINGNGFQITSIDKDFLLNIRLMLTSMGVSSKLQLARLEGSFLMPDGAGGEKEYVCQDTWRLLIGNMSVYKLGMLGLHTSRLQWHRNAPQRDAARFVQVQSVAPLGVTEAFCFEEPLNHTGTFNGTVTGQSEILLRDHQLCNLTEAVARPEDTPESLRAKVEVCTILGVFQSTLTDFKNVDGLLKQNCEEERLLGVSITGVMDSPLLSTVTPETESLLSNLRAFCRSVATEWAGVFGIPISAAITCNKPSGTVAQLTDAGTGGLHPRYAPFYIRTYRQDNKDPLTQFLKDQGVYWEPCLSKPDTQTIFSFAVKSPEGSVLRNDRSAIAQLEHWLMFQRHWCEHKPSITVYVRDHEWPEVGAWVYGHFDEVCGVSFLPYDGGSYQQAPFQEITEAEYLSFIEKHPGVINWDQFIEQDDVTEGAQELACTGGTCLI